MKYEQKSFTVPVSSGGTCDEKTGHCGPDAKGRCLRCGVQFPEAPRGTTYTMTITGADGLTHRYQVRGIPCR